MLWKSISLRSAVSPHVGIGLERKTSYALRRKSRIQAGSFFIDEMRSTISRFRPLSDLNAYVSSGSWNPCRYSSIRASVAAAMVSQRIGPHRLGQESAEVSVLS